MDKKITSQNSQGKSRRNKKNMKEIRPATAPCFWRNPIESEYIFFNEVNEHPCYGYLAIDHAEKCMQDVCVQIHNMFRAKHGCPPLVHDPDLSQFASIWAKTLIKEKKFAYRPNNKYGENIFYHTARSVKDAFHVGAKEAVRSWYDEMKYYIFDKEPRKLKAVHFTQMIWKNTKRIGIGRAVDKNGRVIIVANYDPRGNYRGRFLENCPPPIINDSEIN